MKMRKRIAALIAVAMIAALMPMSTFAASSNSVTKVVTVEKDAQIKKAAVPELKIDVKDELPTGQSFYLHLTDSEWTDVDTQDDTSSVPVKVNDEDLLGAFGALGIDAKVKETTPGSTKDSKIIYFIAKEKDTGTDFVFEAYREDDTTMAIRLLGERDGADFEYQPNSDKFLGTIVFPMIAKVTGAEAVVRVNRFDTQITTSEHVFAVSDAAKANVVVGAVPNLYRSGKIAEITLEERFASSIGDVPSAERWFTLELRDTDFMFRIGDDAQVVGQRAYRYANAEKLTTANYALSKDGTKLAVKISDQMVKDKSVLQRGNIKLEGVEIVAARDAKMGEVKAVIDGNFLDKEIITIAKRGEYQTKLNVPEDWEYDVVAGNEKEVKFTLTEELANSLVGSRPATFTFDKGVKIKNTSGAVSKKYGDWTTDDFLWDDVKPGTDTKLDEILAMPEGTTAERLAKDKALWNWLKGVEETSPILRTIIRGKIEIEGSDVADGDKGKWSEKTPNLIEDRVYISKDRDSFTVDKFELDEKKAGKYTFTTTLLIPAGVTGEVTVSVAGKGVTEETIKILEVEEPVTVEATNMNIKVGLKEIETTGKITIKETAKERLAQGKDIVLRIKDIDNGLKIKSYKATVVEGDLVLGDTNGKWNDDKAIGIKRVSTEPSTIEITDIVMYTDRTVPEGKYDLLVGGDAISRITGRAEIDDRDIDPVVTVKDFVNITTKNTEDIAGSANKAKVAFVVGSTEYLVNGKVEQMDVAPYIKDGRTMVPVRYVAAALGVKPEQVIWDGANQTATVIADKIIQVKLGSKMMLVNGVSFPMAAAAELVSDRTFVPVAEMARALGVPVDWAAENATATFN